LLDTVTPWVVARGQAGKIIRTYKILALVRGLVDPYVDFDMTESALKLQEIGWQTRYLAVREKPRSGSAP